MAEAAEMEARHSAVVQGLKAEVADADGRRRVQEDAETLRAEVARGAQTKHFLHGAPKNHDHYGLSIFLYG